MATKCIGYKHSKGSMYDEANRKDVVWNNHVFYCINDESPDVFGFSSVELKVPAENLFNMTGCNNDIECQSYVNKEINAVYGLVGDKVKLKRIEKVSKPDFTDPGKSVIKK